MSGGAPGLIAHMVGSTGAVVVGHAHGFTMVELLSDEVRLRVGDQVAGDWTTRGHSTFATPMGVLDVYFWGTWETLLDAIRVAHLPPADR